MPAQMSIALPDQDTNELVMRALATDLVRDIDEADDILKRYGLSAGEYAELAQSRQFRSMLAEADKEWSKASNTKERVRLKSAYIIEQALPKLFDELFKDSNPLSSRADLFGRIARIAELGNSTPTAVTGAEAFSITINLGADKPPITIQQQLPPQVTLGQDEYEDL